MVEKLIELYVSVVSGNYNRLLLREEILSAQDYIKDGDLYKDPVETRYSLNKHLNFLAKRIKELPFIKSCNPDPSPKYIKRGLSVYIEVKFKYPEGLSDAEIDKYYSYTIRFSDHPDKHSSERTHKTDPVQIVGRKVKNLEKEGMKAFRSSLSDIQNKIAEFEIDKFEKQLTFFDIS